MTNVLIAAGAFRSSVIFVLIILKETDDVINCVRPSVVGIEALAECGDHIDVLLNGTGGGPQELKPALSVAQLARKYTLTCSAKHRG